MSDVLLTEREWAERMRAERTLKDKSYRVYPLGQEVGRFLRAKRLERAKPATLNSYETTLCAFTLDHRDIDNLELFVTPEGSDLLVEFLQTRWGESAPATLDNRTAALRSFFGWAYDTRRISQPVRLKRRRGGDRKIRQAHALDEIHLIVAAQQEIADEVGLLLMGRLGFRKMDVGRFQVRDVDLAHDLVYVRQGKGDKPAELPIVFDDLRVALSLWLSDPSASTGGSRHPEEYLWHPRDNPRKAPDSSTVHRRFKRCLERARVDDFPMHELRHSAGDRLWRETGNLLAAKQLLRHSSVATTERYLHPTSDDLRASMKASDG